VSIPYEKENLAEIFAKGSITTNDDLRDLQAMRPKLYYLKKASKVIISMPE